MVPQTKSGVGLRVALGSGVSLGVCVMVGVNVSVGTEVSVAVGMSVSVGGTRVGVGVGAGAAQAASRTAAISNGSARAFMLPIITTTAAGLDNRCCNEGSLNQEGIRINRSGISPMIGGFTIFMVSDNISTGIAVQF
jgi:hypothetical protein